MKSLRFYCAVACLGAVVLFNLYGEHPSAVVHAQAATPHAPVPVRPLMISNGEWTFNLNNVCTAGSLSVYHVLGTKEPMKLSMGGLDATLTQLVEGGTWIKTGMPLYINLNNVASARMTKADTQEIEITFSDGFKEQLSGEGAKLFIDAAAKLAVTK